MIPVKACNQSYESKIYLALLNNIFLYISEVDLLAMQAADLSLSQAWCVHRLEVVADQAHKKIKI